MGDLKGPFITWSESIRRQLVEAVIKVEEEISAAPGTYPVAKWARIAVQLPVEFRGKVWSNKKQKLSYYKCQGMFFELLKVYKDKTAGKNSAHSRRTMTDVMWALMKKREDSLNARNSNFQAEKNMSKLSGSDGATGSRSAYDQHPHVPEQSNDRSVTANGKIQWTEALRLQVVEAVIRIEKHDLRFKSNEPKWERIVRILPPELRSRTWSSERQSFNMYKCQQMFQHLVTAYRGLGAPSKESFRDKYRLLTKPVYVLLQKRDAMLKARKSARASEKDVESGADIGSFSASFENISDGSDFDNNEVDNNVNPITEEKSMQTDNSRPSSSEFASRSVSEVKDSGSSPKDTAIPTWRCGSKSVNPMPKDRYLAVVASNLDARVGVRTRAQNRAHNRGRRPESNSCTRPSSSNSRSSGSKRGSTPVGMHGTGRGDGSPRRRDLEFSRLSAWVKGRAAQVGRKMMHEMTLSAIRSYVRRRMNGSHSSHEGIAKQHGEVIERSFSKIIGRRIRSAACGFAAGLESTSMELAEEIVQEFYSKYPGLNNRVGPRQSPVKKGGGPHLTDGACTRELGKHIIGRRLNLQLVRCQPLDSE